MSSGSLPEQAYSAGHDRHYPPSPIVDCGWYGDKDGSAQEHLIVTARGRDVIVPLGVTLLLHHVQKALQAELGMLDQSFDIYDCHSNRLRTDQDLREAVMGGRTPLSAVFSDNTHNLIENQREELAQIICQLIGEHCNESDEKLSALCQQVDSLKRDMHEQKSNLSNVMQGVKDDLYGAIEVIKDMVTVSGAGQVDLSRAGDVSSSGARGPSEERVANLEAQQLQFEKGLNRHNQHLETRLEEMKKSMTSIMAEQQEFLTRIATEEVQAVAERCKEIDARLVRAELERAEQVEARLVGKIRSEREKQEKEAQDRFEAKQRPGQGTAVHPTPISPLGQYSARSESRAQMASPMRLSSKVEQPAPGRSKSPMNKHVGMQRQVSTSSLLQAPPSGMGDAGREFSRETIEPQPAPFLSYTGQTSSSSNAAQLNNRWISLAAQRDGQEYALDQNGSLRTRSIGIDPNRSKESATRSVGSRETANRSCSASATSGQHGQRQLPMQPTVAHGVASSPPPVRRNVDQPQHQLPISGGGAFRGSRTNATATNPLPGAAGAAAHPGNAGHPGVSPTAPSGMASAGGHQVGMVMKTT